MNNSICFATNIYEKAIKDLLIDGGLRNQLNKFIYPFAEKIITINNVNDRNYVENILKKDFQIVNIILQTIKQLKY